MKIPLIQINTANIPVRNWRARTIVYIEGLSIRPVSSLLSLLESSFRETKWYLYSLFFLMIDLRIVAAPKLTQALIPASLGISYGVRTWRHRPTKFYSLSNNIPTINVFAQVDDINLCVALVIKIDVVCLPPPSTKVSHKPTRHSVETRKIALRMKIACLEEIILAGCPIYISCTFIDRVTQNNSS